MDKSKTRRASKKHISTVLPDVSGHSQIEFAGALSQVGMRKIEMPILFPVNGKNIYLPAMVSAYVSLDAPDVKGIHMSRLYLELKNNLPEKPLSSALIKKILHLFLDSHEGLSDTAFLEISFLLPVERPALLSDKRGYRHYPFVYQAKMQKNSKMDLALEAEILYSSTCPCSAALARQHNRDEFQKEFAKSEMIKKSDVDHWFIDAGTEFAVPHAQRSLARVKIRLDNGHLPLQPQNLVDLLELAVQTPVQAAVKRVDEQEFARLNGANLMFCEDAARKIRSALENEKKIVDYSIYVEHQESLHPHDAVSRVTKGVPGGFQVEF